MPEKVIQAMEDRVPMKRMAQPEEIANLYAFLASDEASYINGAAIEITGGLTCNPRRLLVSQKPLCRHKGFCFSAHQTPCMASTAHNTQHNAQHDRRPYQFSAAHKTLWHCGVTLPYCRYCLRSIRWPEATLAGFCKRLMANP